MKKTIVRKHKRKGRIVRRHLRRIKTTKRFRRYKSRKSLDQILNYSSYPKIEEKLGKRKKEAFTTKKDIKQFFQDWPEYKEKTKGLTKISILGDRKSSIEIDPGAKTDPGMYIPKEEQIRLLPIKPDFIPPEEQERAKRFYTSKKDFPAALVHELYHYEKMPKKLKEFLKMDPWKQRDVSIKKIKFELEPLAEKHERGAVQAEDIWFEKKRRRELR